MFYLSDREIIAAFEAAAERGAELCLLLDPNKDAFGRTKNGVPNRPVAAELRPHEPFDGVIRTMNSAMPRWSSYDIQAQRTSLSPARANLTRRNLDDYNLEANLIVRAASSAAVMRDAHAYFERVWSQ